MRALASLCLTCALSACAEQPSPEQVAGERLAAGDQRLIGYDVVAAPTYSVIGVKCETTGFPLRVLRTRREIRDTDREIKAAARFNRVMVSDARYTQAVCKPFGDNVRVGLARAADKSTRRPTETFEDIFGFSAPRP